ncbi:ATP-binding protein [Kitasatospora sp. NBC_00240]|uniref:AAA family ATPase n=1 Tax=Kitasatospora sp. NBC_00240 TaxID=2903567 RepID=UPI00224F92BA|nr:AAA family ATPase [Kitasatospora sp. NBC_00240]MCX5209297.1 ATP-binding protein [Kitasatospora sp. NBC_00240]
MADLMPRLEAAYKNLSFQVRPVLNPDRRTVLRSWDDALQDGTGIVHVISHGTTSLADGARSRQAEDSEQLCMVPSCGDAGFGTNVTDWIRHAHRRPRPTLFVVDLCRAGRAARIGHLTQVQEAELHAWVIAATGPDEPTYDGLFSTAVAEVLEEIAKNGLDTSESLRFVRWDRVTRAIQQRLELSGGRQRIHTTKVDTSQPLPELPFFPNPNWRDDPRTQRLRALGPPIRAFVADLAAEHFIDRVGKHFVGRRAQLAELAPWLDGVSSEGLRVVTGAPGAGKSALLGALVCAGHLQIVAAAPDIRAHLAAQHPDGTPSPNPLLAAIHARGRSLDDVLASLSTQWWPEPRAELRTASELIEAVCALPQAPALVFDALDEADLPSDMVDRLLIPLAKAVRPDGSAACRLLVGTRRGARFGELLGLARRRGVLIDLDDVPPAELGADLAQHISWRLADLPAYREPDRRTVRGVLARTIAATLAGDAERHRQWGPFLVAQIFGRALESLEAPRSTEEAVRLGERVPRTLPEVLELELSLHPDSSRLRAVLATVAWSKGEGFPIDAITAVAPEFDPGVTDDNVRLLLEAGRFYLRTGVELDGSTLFRLFHQGLADHLKAAPHLPHTHQGSL